MKVTSPHNARGRRDSRRAESVWDEIRFRLERRRDEILERIGGYPTPIPACDVDFNRLLEERARVFEELNRLKSLSLSDNSRRNDHVIRGFVVSCASLSEEDRGALRALLDK